MDTTIGYVLCSQSPALFLLALVLFLGYLFRRKNHKVMAVLDLVLCFICLGGGVALYFLGMSWDYFTIHNFYEIHTPGLVGLIVVAVLAVFVAIRAFAKMADERRTEKAAIRAENARLDQEKREAKEAEKKAKEAEKAAHQAQQEAELAAAQMVQQAPPPVPEEVAPAAQPDFPAAPAEPHVFSEELPPQE